MRREDGVRPQKRAPQSPEKPAVAVNRDDGDEREHGARRDQQGSENRKVDRDDARYLRRGSSYLRTEQPAEQDKDQDGHPDGAKDAERLPHEDLDFEPRQSPESAQHDIGSLSFESCDRSA